MKVKFIETKVIFHSGEEIVFKGKTLSEIIKKLNENAKQRAKEKLPKDLPVEFKIEYKEKEVEI